MATRAIATCDCSFTGTYATVGLAERSLRRHSCDRHRTAHAATSRRKARDAAVDRTPRPCSHPRAAHEHGTYAAYTLDQCRCLPCTAANSQYETTRTRDRAYGRTAYVDAGPAVTHLRELAAAGLGWKRAARAAGVPLSTARRLTQVPADGPAPRARAATVAALLSVPTPTLDTLGGATLVEATGTRRRLQALLALGWSVRRLSVDHDLNRQALDRALTNATVTVRTARAVRDVYDQIGDRTPPQGTPADRGAAARARARAAQCGWPVPAAWDDATLDDPAAPTPSTHAPRSVLDLDEWVHLVRGGEEPARAAGRCGVRLSAVEQAARRAGRRDVLRLLVTLAA